MPDLPTVHPLARVRVIITSMAGVMCSQVSASVVWT